MNSMHTIWKSKMFDNLKRSFFRATVESVLIYGHITWTLKSTLEKKVDGAYSQMIRTVLNKTWKQYLTNTILYGKIQTITNSTPEQLLICAGHFWRSKNELTSDVLLWQPLHGKISRGLPTKTYIDQLMEDIGCTLDELPTAMNERNGWKQLVKNCRACSIW